MDSKRAGEPSGHDLRLCQPNGLRGTTDSGEPCVRTQIALLGTNAKKMTVRCQNTLIRDMRVVQSHSTLAVTCSQPHTAY